jgi:hypothetical protein
MPASSSDFDFAALAEGIAQASRAALADISERCGPQDPVCAFTLYTDDGAMTVCPALLTESQVRELTARHPDEAGYYRYSSSEWPMEGEGANGAFNDLCTLVREHVLALPDEDGDTAFTAFRAQLLETMVQVLERLRREDPAFARESLLLQVSVSDGDEPAEVLNQWVARLNPPAAAAEFKAWTDSWG